MFEVLQWVVGTDENALRLDAVLIRHLPSFSRREITALTVNGQVLVNERPGKKGMLVHTGDRVSLGVVRSLPPNPMLPIPIIHADAALVVLDKPADIPSLALHHADTVTVANFLIAHFPETTAVSPRPLEAGVVHRLDTATSGLLLAARTSYAYTALREQFRARSVKKTYLAIVEGLVRDKGQVSLSLVPEGPRGQRMRAVSSGRGQAAITSYTPLEILPMHTLLRLSIETGVRHQIRTHLATLGHPIVGDVSYGAQQQTPRLCLHAATLVFHHPVTGQKVKFTSPIPQDFSTILQALRTRTKISNTTEKGPLSSPTSIAGGR